MSETRPPTRYSVLLQTIPQKIASELGSADAAKEALRRVEGCIVESMIRERVLQMLALLNWRSRLEFLLRNPSLVLPYLVRIRRSDPTYTPEFREGEPPGSSGIRQQTGGGDDVE